MASPRRRSSPLKALCDASLAAFFGLWPALASACPKLSSHRRFEALAAGLLFILAERAAAAAGLGVKALASSQLSRLGSELSKLGPLEQLAHFKAYAGSLEVALNAPGPPARVGIDEIAAVYEALLGVSLPELEGGEGRRRKRSGSYYTPPSLARQVVAAALEGQSFERSLEALELKVLDPAVGAGVFLIEACRALAARLKGRDQQLSESQAMARVAKHCLYGVDINPLSIAVSEVCLWLAVADDSALPGDFSGRLRHGDALVGLTWDEPERAPQERENLAELVRSGFEPASFDWQLEFPEVRTGFDLVLGNPPWVAYAGRSAEPLPRALREYYARGFRAWRGFPSLHGLFVERACRLARQGSVALLLPSPVADLDGYQYVRSTLSERHRVRRPLLEFGQDAFEGVTQPCFALVADATPDAAVSGERWQLCERQRATGAATTLEVPAVLEILQRAAPLAKDHFGEMGFQTSKLASQRLLLRAPEPDARHTLALLEGRNVSEFAEGPPKLFLCADPEQMKQAGCRLRPVADYQRVDFVVRQTASVPIAALHGGLAFRNSLLAGFGSEEHSAPLLVALLNSSLYRALHLAGQRDARQAAFPQVKIKHLRALPRPPREPRVWRALESLALAQTGRGTSSAARADLDALVFDLFGIPGDHRSAVLGFLKGRAPRYAPELVPAPVTPDSELDSVRRALGVA